MGRVALAVSLLALLVIFVWDNKVQSQLIGNDCKNDVILIVDTSFSIGKENFDDNIKPFLQRFVSDPTLNIAYDGTNLALMVFSSERLTKVLYGFRDDQYHTSILNRLNRLNWEDVKGGHTRTDVALKKANEIFKNRSPYNHRSDARDVVILLTDGHPHGIANAEEEAVIYAERLKVKDVLIIGVAVGDALQNTSYHNTLKRIASPGQTFGVTFNNIDDILTLLVDRSCAPFRTTPAVLPCKCPTTDLGNYVPRGGRNSIEISWDVPTPNCESELDSIIPNVKPGDSFTAGTHTILYRYNVDKDDDLICNVTFTVQARQISFCRGAAFFPSAKDCCCGALHDKRIGYECCGIGYYSTAVEKCCPHANIKRRDQPCEEPSCDCPDVSLGVAYLKSGIPAIPISWEKPKPNCESRLKASTPRIRSGQSFSVGSYSVKYTYTVHQILEVSCKVSFEVRECSCPTLFLSSQKVTPGATLKLMYWKQPRPNCPGARIVDKPRQRSGDYFPIGQHNLGYTYNIANQFNITCEVQFEIRGALCRDKGYDVSRQICCCGKIYDIRRGYACCADKYYATAIQKCCKQIGPRPKGVPCPRQLR